MHPSKALALVFYWSGPSGSKGQLCPSWWSRRDLTEILLRAYHCSLLFENRVYVLGGEGVDKKIFNSMLVLTDWGWDHAKEMNFERKRLSCSVFRDRIWACGGIMTYHRRKEASSGRTSVVSIPHKTCESYHPQVCLLKHFTFLYHVYRVDSTRNR